ncbi:hypothetical protein INT43_005744 [Umbelopsis isabellina]|uniref:Uncharacterized protein n=1 Tax=Mortierella isabellina TaxID=91625 RepID=A0A8H7PLT0_MORIS|nr:hypothetical protein INT43_005744 [Umbelopsis isabellina]
MDSNVEIVVITIAIVVCVAALAFVLIRHIRRQNAERSRHIGQLETTDTECRSPNHRHWLSKFSKKSKAHKSQPDMYCHNFYTLSEPQSLAPAYLSWTTSSAASPTQQMLEGYETPRSTMEENMDPIQLSLVKQDEADRIWYHSNSSSIFNDHYTKRLSEPGVRHSIEYSVW